MKDAALDYAARGWAVFPLHTPNPTGGCSCRKKDCKNVGKHPRTQHGKDDATTDVATIARWWDMWPTANIGIACRASGLVALDIDPKNGGEESFDALRERWGFAPFETLTSITGGGGTHLVYLAPDTPIGDVVSNERFTGPLGPGIDVRGPGYIVAPPSIHETGALYEWEADWSPDDREPMRLPPELVELLTIPSPVTADRSSRVDTAAILAGVPEGERDWQLFLLAAKLRGADVPIDMAYDLIERAATACTPPFSAREARKKVDSAYRYPAGRTAIEVARTAEETGPPDLEAMRYLLDDAVAHGVPEPAWAVKDVLVRGKVHNVYGEPESGKTIIALSWMAEVAARGENVIYFDEESGAASVAVLMASMGLRAPDNHIHYIPFASLDIAGYEQLMAAVHALQPALVVFDSLTDMLASAGLDENSGKEVTQWMKGVAQALAIQDYAPAVVVIDHVTKDTSNTKYSVGTRAKKAKSDVQWYVQKVSDFNRLQTAPVLLRRTKNRPAVLPEVVRYVVGGEAGRLICRREEYSANDIKTELTDRQQKVLDILGEASCPLEVSEIRGEFDDPRPSKDALQKDLDALMKWGLADRNGTGKSGTSYTYFISADSAASGASSVVSVVPKAPTKSADNPPLISGGVGAFGDGSAVEKRKERLRAHDDD